MDSHDRLAKAQMLVARAKAAMLHTQRLRADWRLHELERERLLRGGTAHLRGGVAQALVALAPGVAILLI